MELFRQLEGLYSLTKTYATCARFSKLGKLAPWEIQRKREQVCTQKKKKRKGKGASESTEREHGREGEGDKGVQIRMERGQKRK